MRPARLAHNDRIQLFDAVSLGYRRDSKVIVDVINGVRPAVNPVAVVIAFICGQSIGKSMCSCIATV